MSGDIDFDQHLEAYLAIRDALGLTAGTRGRLLHNFLDYTRGAAEPDMPIRAMTAVAWACDHAPPGCGDAGKAHRLMVARGFLTYLSAVVPGTEVPATPALHFFRRRDRGADRGSGDGVAARWPATDHARHTARPAGQHGPADR
jgi:integrase/recombinase XerD